MNIRGITGVVSSFLYFLTAIVGVGCLVSAYYAYLDPASIGVLYAFIKTLIFTTFVAVCCEYSAAHDEELQLKDAILSVLSIWLLSIFFCSLPFTLSGALDHSVDAVFETASAITTTGASILHPKHYAPDGAEIPIHAGAYTFYGTVKASGLIGTEAFPAALLFWRSLLSWVGGAGMVLLFVAFLPSLGMEAKKLFRYESTGPTFSPIFPQVRKAATVLLKIYGGLTLLCLLFLLVTNDAMHFFDALNISLCTISTSGFGVKNASIASYHSLATEVIIMIFMIAGAVNFSWYYDMLRGRWYKLWNPELVAFFTILLGLSCLVSYSIYNTMQHPLTATDTQAQYGCFEALRYGFFQTISSMTTTGFATVNFDLWPYFAQALMLVSMFFGGMSGSTTAGLKIIRVCILAKCLTFAIQSIFKHNEVRIMRIGGREIQSETIVGVLTFFLTTIVTSLLGVLLLVLNNVDFETAFSLNACMINNAGMSFRMAGPVESCAFLSPFSKSICVIWMLLGRLEFYAWFTLLLPSFWKR